MKSEKSRWIKGYEERFFFYVFKSLNTTTAINKELVICEIMIIENCLTGNL